MLLLLMVVRTVSRGFFFSNFASFQFTFCFSNRWIIFFVSTLQQVPVALDKVQDLQHGLHGPG